MGALMRLELDSAGFREVLNSGEMRAMVDGAAARIAAAARPAADGAEVLVSPYTTDRAAAAVVIADWRGMELQARDGVLTRAAGSIGAEVKAR